VLDGFNIAKYFEVIVGGDVVPFRKPDPRHLLTALEQLRAAPNESIMIGDNENDYSAARAAGIAVILMRYGYPRVPPETLMPDAWLDQFADIPPALDRINRKR
jgi:phosphoglycolate phosphatase